ncbi:hypothetical protein [Desulfitobacterium hafniense]|nr:hypothetical protein [Desulfitobacterium hafniense]
MKKRTKSRTVLTGGSGAVPSRLEALQPKPVRYSGRDRYPPTLKF